MRFLISALLVISVQVAFAYPGETQLSSAVLFDAGRKSVSFKVVFEKRMNCNLMKKMDVFAFNGPDGLVFRDMTYTTLPNHRPRMPLNSICILRGTSPDISVRPYEKIYFRNETEMRIVQILAIHSDGVVLDLGSDATIPVNPGPAYPMYPQPTYPNIDVTPYPEQPSYPAYPSTSSATQCTNEPPQPYNPHHPEYPQQQLPPCDPTPGK